MDEKRVSITDHIGSVTISRATAEKLQRKQPIIRKDSPKRDSDKPTDSEVQSMTIDQDVWTKARDIAEEVAAASFRSQANDPQAELSPEVKVKVRSMASRLIVVNSDTSATVYNNVEQAKKARRVLTQSAKADVSDSTRE